MADVEGTRRATATATRHSAGPLSGDTPVARRLVARCCRRRVTDHAWPRRPVCRPSWTGGTRAADPRLQLAIERGDGSGPPERRRPIPARGRTPIDGESRTVEVLR